MHEITSASGHWNLSNSRCAKPRETRHRRLAEGRGVFLRRDQRPAPSVLQLVCCGTLAEGCELHIEEQQAECWCEQCVRSAAYAAVIEGAALSAVPEQRAAHRGGMTVCRSKRLEIPEGVMYV